MDTNEATGAVVEKPTAPAKKPVKRRKAKPAVKVEKAGVAFPGMTDTECARGCNEKGCVISGKPYCGHPCKGAMTPGDQPALARLQAARKQLGIEKVEKRYG